MGGNLDNQPGWIKLNPQIDRFDPFEDIGIMENDEINHLRYGVNICNYNLLFNKKVLCEATMKANVYPIPNVSEWIQGMINLRGNIIPVFNIEAFLTKDQQLKKENNVVLVIGQGNNAVGLSIHELPVAVAIDEKNVETVSPPDNIPEVFIDCINVAYDVGDKIWLEIDIDTVLNNINSK